MRTVKEIFRERNGRSVKDHHHHWVFDHFPRHEGTITGEFQFAHLGMFIHKKFLGQPITNGTANIRCPLPSNRDEEYFEWVDVLESALDAGDKFTIVELGAGFGRWASAAGLAAKKLGKSVHMVMVEGEPTHAQWCREHMANNGFAENEWTLFEANVSLHNGEAPMMVERPEGDTPASWYGQSIESSSCHVGDLTPTDQSHNGHQVYKSALGYKTINLPTVSLATVLDGLEMVDLIDLDIQGSEGEIVPANIELLSDRVRRLHIETHSPQIEALLREVLYGADWIRLRDYAMGKRDTPFAHQVYFQDGAQSWINPRLY